MRRLALLPGLLAMAPTFAVAEETREAVVWYRSDSGCPDGLRFVDRLAHRGVPARIARVGDPIDFVVTLGIGTGGISGRLERQTERGTVAVREITGETCDLVADAMALTLAVAFSQDAQDAHRLAAPPSPAALAVPAPAPALDEVAPPPPPVAPAEDRSSPRPPPPRSVDWSVGADGAVAAGVSPAPMFGPMIFVEASSGSRRWFAPNVRLSGTYAFGAKSTERGALNAMTAGARLEGCLRGYSAGAWALAPCLGATLGGWWAKGTGSSGSEGGGLWSTVLGGARLHWTLGQGFLEAVAEAEAPLTRVELVFENPSHVVYHTGILGFSGGVGGGLTIP